MTSQAPDRRVRIRCYLLAVSSLLMLGADEHLTTRPSNADLWDVTQGSIVTSTSGVQRRTGGAVRDMFGAMENAVPIERGSTVFKDGQLKGFVHFVEWQTPHPVTIDRVDLYAHHDGPGFDANERGFSRFTLLARDLGTGVFDARLEFSPDNPYDHIGISSLLMSEEIPPVTARQFRAEFVQFGDRSPGQRGPRIVELDGFAPKPMGDMDGDRKIDRIDLNLFRLALKIGQERYEELVPYDYCFLNGDMNGDGSVDHLDEPAFLDLLSGNTTSPILGDVNNDSASDNLDITPFIVALAAGGDEDVFLEQVPTGRFLNADIDQDGFVNNRDITPFIDVLQALVQEPAASAVSVPEPLTAIVFGFGIAVVFGRRARLAASSI